MIGATDLLRAQFRRSADRKLSETEFEKFLAEWFRPLPLAGVVARAGLTGNVSAGPGQLLSLVAWNTESIDTHGIHESGTFTVPAGVWAVSVVIETTQSEGLTLELRANDTAVATVELSQQQHRLEWVGQLTDDSTIELWWAEPVTNSFPTAVAGQSWMTVHRIGLTPGAST